MSGDPVADEEFVLETYDSDDEIKIVEDDDERQIDKEHPITKVSSYVCINFLWYWQIFILSL